jgi:fatty-acyl-CoA synthase
VAALVEEPSLPLIWTHGADEEPFRRIDAEIGEYPGHPLAEAERPPVTVDDLALYIYTSGTTGLPKAANVSHGRLMQWSHWFSGMMHFGPEDRMYNCLPMYHSVGGVQAPGAALVAGGSVVIREKFSASAFWADITRWECTTFQYIGELCRYLLLAAPSPHEAAHRVRLACGNGLAPDVWEGFKQRFRIPQILEFYASTEGGVSLFNVEEKRGAIGRIPPYLAHRFAPALVQIDIEDGQPVRDEQGFCRRAAVGEVGEALGRLVDDPSLVGTKYEGYADREAAERKILRNVFKPGDAWLRTGDLMRRDAQGFYYFVDRMGDTFRWKGENVATSEVAEVLCAFPGVAHATVYGVAVPGADGRAGMAAITASAAGELDLSGLRMHLAERLPAYARPRFLRLRTSVDVTGTFKYAKTELVRQGYDPANTATDPIYFDDPEAQAFVPLSAELYERIQGSRVRL